MSGFIDYLTIMLIDLAGGLINLTWFLWKLNKPKEYSKFVSGFLLVGILGLLTSLPMVLTWPLPGSYNIAFGEPMLLFSLIFLLLAISIIKQWPWDGIVVFAVLGSIMAIVIGIAIYSFNLTNTPFFAMMGYLMTAFGALISSYLVYRPKNKPLLILATILFVLSTILWLYIGYYAYYMHLSSAP